MPTLPPSRHGYAQTHLQLEAQLAAAGAGGDERATLRRAHDLARELLGARHRGSGKTFLAHLIGTASIAAAHGGDPTAVLAALLHAAYDQGDFGDGATGATPARRAELRAVLGDEAEALVEAYTRFSWKPWLPPRDAGRATPAATAGLAATAPAPAAPPGRVADLDARGRDVLFLRACNALEDTLDDALAHSGAAKRSSTLRQVHAAIGLAEALGHTALAAELAAAAARAERAGAPPADAPSASFTVVPRSLRSFGGWWRWRRAHHGRRGPVARDRPP